MRIALISDLHSFAGVLLDVLEDIAARNVDTIVCLGDIVDIGPQPSEVISILRQRGIQCIGGNHDALDQAPPVPFLRDVETWTREVLSDEENEWLQNLPFSKLLDIEGQRILCVHGSPRSDEEGILAETPATELNHWLDEANADIIVAGHTHVQVVRQLANGVVVNVGSISMPFAEANAVPPDVLKYSDFAILDITASSTSVELIRIPLNFEALTLAVNESGMPHAETLINGYVD